MIAFLLCLYFLKVLIYILLRILTLLSFNRCKFSKARNFLEANLFFRELFAIIIEGTFVVLIGTYLCIREHEFKLFGETLAFALAILSCLILGILLPVSFILLLRKDTDDLKYNESFK